MSNTANIDEVLKTHWGYDAFRPFQKEIIQSVVGGKDTLALMPTGGGKSICFQVPVLAQEGIGVVISPLIALMKDQVENLNKRGIKAVAIYAGMTYREIDVALDNCVYGDVKFLYVSPERTTTTLFRERFKKMNISLLAIDEAHCISQWGHDFRPAYLNIIELRELHDTQFPFLAVTATANDRVVNDMLDQLEIPKATVFKQSFVRDNLGYLLLKEENKEERLLTILNKSRGSAIVYVGTRKKTVDVSNFLNSKGISSDYYHGGLNQQDRTAKQDKWISNKTRVIVATNAFGMGIDKPDVRVVVHLDVPSSPEAYFQEAGRAGRDGERAYATLLYKDSNRIDLEKLHELEFPDKKIIKQVYNALGNFYQLAIGAGEGESYLFKIGEFGNRFNLKPVTIYNAIKILALDGYVELSDAIYHPTTLKILVSTKDLYEFQVRNKGFDILIRFVLRKYPGIFDSFKKIDLFDIAKEAKLSVAKVNDAFLKLKQLELIDYVESHDSPILTYTRARLNEKSLSISKQSYLDRKKIKKGQLDFMIRYCESEFICRNRLLLLYFDETSFKDCGICDVCIERKKKGLDNYDFEAISQHAKELLSIKPNPIQELVKKMPFPEEKSIKVLQFMLDNRMLKVNKQHQLELKK